MPVKALKCKYYNATLPCDKGGYEECVTNITCPTDDVPQICYAVLDSVHDVFRVKGCRREDINDNCEQNRCVGQYKGNLTYCCCYNDFCNDNYVAPLSPRLRYVPPTAEWTFAAWILLIVPFFIIAAFFLTFCLGYCPYISRSRDELDAGMTELEYLQPPRREGEEDDDDDDENADDDDPAPPPPPSSSTQSPTDEAAAAASPASFSSQRTTGDFSPVRTESSISAKSPTAVVDISPRLPTLGETRVDIGNRLEDRSASANIKPKPNNHSQTTPRLFSTLPLQERFLPAGRAKIGQVFNIFTSQHPVHRMVRTAMRSDEVDTIVGAKGPVAGPSGIGAKGTKARNATGNNANHRGHNHNGHNHTDLISPCSVKSDDDRGGIFKGEVKAPATKPIEYYIRGIGTKNIEFLDESPVCRNQCTMIKKAIWTDTIDGKTTREIAVKMTHPKEIGYWKTEVEILSCDNIRHQNIIEFLGSSKTRDKVARSYWLMLEYVPGGNLLQYLRDNTLCWNDFYKIAIGIARGIAHLHDLDIAHRDFKSKNVLLREDLTPCICDFANATMLRELFASDVNQVAQVGTPRYMPPEVLEGSVTFSTTAFCKIDVYSLSLVLWELLTRLHQRMPGPPIGPDPPQLRRKPSAKQDRLPGPGASSAGAGVEVNGVGHPEVPLEKPADQPEPQKLELVKQDGAPEQQVRPEQPMQPEQSIQPQQETQDEQPQLVGPEQQQVTQEKKQVDQEKPSKEPQQPEEGQSASSEQQQGSQQQRQQEPQQEPQQRPQQLERLQKQQQPRNGISDDSPSVDKSVEIEVPNEPPGRIFCQPHRLPYSEMVSSRPTMKEMKHCVADDKYRPAINIAWNIYPLSEVCRTIVDGWFWDSDARISSACVVQRLEFMNQVAVEMVERRKNRKGQ